MIERMPLLNPAAIDWSIALQVLPELLLLFFGIVLVALDLFAPRQRQLLPWLTILGVLVVLFMDRQTRPGLGGDMVLHDGYATFFITLCLPGSFFYSSCLLCSRYDGHVCRRRPHDHIPGAGINGLAYLCTNRHA